MSLFAYRTQTKRCFKFYHRAAICKYWPNEQSRKLGYCGLKWLPKLVQGVFHLILKENLCYLCKSFLSTPIYKGVTALQVIYQTQDIHPDIRYPNTRKWVEKRDTSEFFNFEVFGYLMKHFLECVVWLLNVLIIHIIIHFTCPDSLHGSDFLYISFMNY